MQGTCMTSFWDAFKLCKSWTPLLMIGSVTHPIWNYNLLLGLPPETVVLLWGKSSARPKDNSPSIMNSKLVTLWSIFILMHARITATLLRSNLSNMVVDHKGIDSLFGWFSIACTHLVPAFSILNKFIYCHLNFVCSSYTFAHSYFSTLSTNL